MNEIESAYHNAYLLITGRTTYDKLAENEVFDLPENHEEPDVVLKYYESIEDYEKCKNIVERNS